VDGDGVRDLTRWRTTTVARRTAPTPPRHIAADVGVNDRSWKAVATNALPNNTAADTAAQAPSHVSRE
jgi:hypothetical protein